MSAVRLGPVEGEDLEERKRRPGLEGTIYRGLLDLVGRHREAILRDFPDPRIVRRNIRFPVASTMLA